MKFLKNIFIVFAAFVLAMPVYSLASSHVHKNTHATVKRTEKQKSNACKEDAELLEESEETDVETLCSDFIPDYRLFSLSYQTLHKNCLRKYSLALAKSRPRYLLINRFTI